MNENNCISMCREPAVIMLDDICENDLTYDVYLESDREVDVSMDVAIEHKTYQSYQPGDGIDITNDIISIAKDLIIDCGTSTTVLWGR